VHAVWEALGPERVQAIQSGQRRLGTIFCTMNGCVQFSRRFFGEVLENPALASPILFPETVHNSPASHLAALLGSSEINYTLVGDSAQFMAGLDLAAQWLEQDLVDLALVVAAEELDWLSDEGLLLFAEAACSAEGAAAVVVERSNGALAPRSVRVGGLQEATYGARLSRNDAATRVRTALDHSHAAEALLCDGLGNGIRVDQAEAEAWQDWSGRRLSLKSLLGEGFTVSSGWQTALACECLARGEAQSAVVSAVGNTAQVWGLTLER
jgi:3-oxoacyl-(acyl-carrier-protein) synthase